MFVFHRSEYVGRSIQKRKPLNDLNNKPILEKYNSIIDKYLFSSKQAKKNRIERLHSMNGPVLAEKSNQMRQKSLFYPNLIEKSFNTLNIDDFKLPACKSRNQVILDGCIRKKCITPSFEKQKVEKKFRAKSVHARQYSKMSKMLQTDQNIIFENESQDEESPVKFTPIYA